MRSAGIVIAATAIMAASQVQGQLGGISGGLISGISTNCQIGLASLLGNADLNSCLAITSIVGQLGSISGNDSLVGPLNTYIGSDLCPANVCSNSTLSSANSTINSACGSDIQNNTNILPGLLQLVISNYDEV